MLISKPELSLAKLCAKEESRFALGAIAVDKKHTVVTNGHYLVAVEHTALDESSYPATPGLTPGQPNGKPVLVHFESALSALKALPKKNNMPILDNAALGDDGKVYVNDLSNVVSFAHPVEGTFPQWEKVLPGDDKKPKATIELSGEYLAMLATYFQKHADFGRLKLTIYDDQTSMKLEGKTSDNQRITALLMPIRPGTVGV